MSQKSSHDQSHVLLINSLLFILVGALLCIFRASLLNWAMTAIGVVLIVIGVLKAVKKELIEGVIMAAFGVALVMGGWLFVEIILILLGIALIAKGVLDLVTGIQKKSATAIVASAITLTVGILLTISKWALLDWLFVLMGIVLIIDGLLMLIPLTRE